MKPAIDRWRSHGSRQADGDDLRARKKPAARRRKPPPAPIATLPRGVAPAGELGRDSPSHQLIVARGKRRRLRPRERFARQAPKDLRQGPKRSAARAAT